MSFAFSKVKEETLMAIMWSLSDQETAPTCNRSTGYIQLPLDVYEEVRQRFRIMPWTLFEWLDSEECDNAEAVKTFLINRDAHFESTRQMSDDQLILLLQDAHYMLFLVGSNLFGHWKTWNRVWLENDWVEDAEVEEWSKMGWNRRRHTNFGSFVNQVFTAFLLGYIRVVCTDKSEVPDADPEMVEETLESLHRF